MLHPVNNIHRSCFLEYFYMNLLKLQKTGTENYFRAMFFSLLCTLHFRAPSIVYQHTRGYELQADTG